MLDQLYDQGSITAREPRRGERRRRCRSPRTSGSPARAGRRRTSSNYVTDQLVAEYGAERVFGGGLEVDDDDRPRPPGRRPREAIEKVLHDPDGPAAALVAIDPRTGAREGDVRRHELPAEPVQPRHAGRAAARLVVQADRARERVPAGDRALDAVHVQADRDRRGRPRLEGLELRGHATSATSTSPARWSRPTTPSTPSSRRSSARSRSSTRRKRLGIRSQLPAYFSIGLGAVAVNPLDMTRAYATIANDGKRVDGSIMGDRPAGRANGQVRAQRQGARAPTSGRADPSLTGRGGDAHVDPREVVTAGHRQARAASAAARRPARPARPTTTATPGSSATRPSSPWRCGSATRTSSGRWRRSSTASRSPGGTLPALIWKAFMTARSQRRAAPQQFTSAPYLPSTSRDRLPRRPLAARQRLLPGHARRSRTSPARRRARRRAATRTRSRCRSSSGAPSSRPASRSRPCRSTPDVDLRPR